MAVRLNRDPGERALCARHNNRLDHLTHYLIVDAYDRDFCHVRQLGDNFLDVFGINPVRSALDHVARASLNV